MGLLHNATECLEVGVCWIHCLRVTETRHQDHANSPCEPFELWLLAGSSYVGATPSPELADALRPHVLHALESDGEEHVQLRLGGPLQPPRAAQAVLRAMPGSHPRTVAIAVS